MKKTSIGIYFDKRGMRAGHLMIKWLVYHDSKTRLFSTGFEITESEADFLKNSKNGISGRVKNEKLILLWNRVYGVDFVNPDTKKVEDSFISKGQSYLGLINDNFSFDNFAKAISGQISKDRQTEYPTDLFEALRNKRKRIEEQGNMGSANLFRSTEVSFQRFSTYKGYSKGTPAKLPITSVTSKFLKEYERWMLTNGKAPQPKKDKDGTLLVRKGTPASISMVGIYCRNIRTIFNEAIEEKAVDADLYPFGKGGYVIPTATNKKKALSADIISQLFSMEFTSIAQERARDLWLFSYLCNGMNFKDICLLKQSDYKRSNQCLEFVREKTKRSNRKGVKTIRVHLLPEAISIIERHANMDGSPTDYLFPFLDNEMDADRQSKVINLVIHRTNKGLKRISTRLGPGVKIRTYEARHSFATTLLRSAAPIAFISGSLGHSSIATTEKYLGSFEEEQTKSYMSALIPKKQESQDS